MSDLLQYIIVGLASGSVYALAGLGLVLTYKTSGLLNFAHGALGTAAAYIFYTLHVEHGVPWPFAAVVSVGILGPVLGIGFERFGRGLSRTPMLWRIAATVGILVSTEGLFTVIYGLNVKQFGHFLPQSTFEVFGAYVSWEELITAATALAGAVGLSVFFRVTRMGIAMRAVVDDPDNLASTGISPITVRRCAWVIGCTFATLSGLLFAPSVNLDPAVLTLLVVQAFGAAAVGGFTSLPLTYAGGIVIGVATSIVTKYSGGLGSILGGVPASLPFIVLFIVLLVAPKARLAVKEVAVYRRPISWRAPNRAQVVGAVLVVGLLALAPIFAEDNIDQWTLMLTQVILFLSLGLLVRSSGQVSLCQVTFAAIGAAVFSRLTLGAGVPWLLALLLSGLAVVPVGIVLAIPAIRRSGLYLALATLGFGLLVQSMFYQTDWMFHADGSGASIPLPGITFLGTPDGYYYTVLAITIICASLVVAITRSRLGRLLSGIADSSLAVRAQGTSTVVTLVLVFCISAFLAAISGGLSGGVLGAVTGANFDPFMSLVSVAVVMISVGGTPWYGLTAAAPIVLLPVYIDAPTTLQYLQLLFGATAVFVALRGQPPFPAQRLIDRWFGSRAKDKRGAASPQRSRVRAGTSPPRKPEAALELDGVGVRYGGLVAIKDLSLRVAPGQVTGLIGPNGAGKTSALNVCSGLVRPCQGRVGFAGRILGRAALPARARLGIGRTFQQIELFETLTVRENLALGCEGAMAGAGVFSQLVVIPGQRRMIDERVTESADRVGLTHLLDTQVGALSTGQRRLVEFGRCLAGPYSMVLLDEPSSGLDHIETAEFGRILGGVVRERGLGVLLVEHDMSLVMNVCDTIYVMEFGAVVFKGTPEEVRASELVRAAYLGDSVATADTSAVAGTDAEVAR